MQVITNDFVLTSENSTELTQLKKLLESARKLLVALAQAKLGSKILNQNSRSPVSRSLG